MSSTVSIDSIISKLKKTTDVVLKEVEEKRSKIRTGDFLVDTFLGGGIFHPGFVYLWGGEGTSKSTWSSQIARAFKKQFPNALIVVLDTEESYDSRRWISLGWSIDELKQQVIIVEPEYIQAIRTILNNLWEETKGKIPMLVIWDSVSSTPAKEEYIDNMDRIGTMARTLSMELRNWKIGKNNTTFIAISQYRENIGNPYAGQEPPGGRALRHKSDLTLLLSASNPDKKILNPTYAKKVKVKVQKSRIVSPGVSFDFIATTSRGMSVVWTVINYLFSMGLLDKPKGKRKFVFVPENKEYSPQEFIESFFQDGAYTRLFEPIVNEILSLYPEDDIEYIKNNELENLKQYYFGKNEELFVERWTTIPKEFIPDKIKTKKEANK